jgi:hypothetical protein
MALYRLKGLLSPRLVLKPARSRVRHGERLVDETSSDWS